MHTATSPLSLLVLDGNLLEQRACALPTGVEGLELANISEDDIVRLEVDLKYSQQRFPVEIFEALDVRVRRRHAAASLDFQSVSQSPVAFALVEYTLLISFTLPDKTGWLAWNRARLRPDI